MIDILIFAVTAFIVFTVFSCKLIRTWTYVSIPLDATNDRVSMIANKYVTTMVAQTGKQLPSVDMFTVLKAIKKIEEGKLKNND